MEAFRVLKAFLAFDIFTPPELRVLVRYIIIYIILKTMKFYFKSELGFLFPIQKYIMEYFILCDECYTHIYKTYFLYFCVFLNVM